jgi:hypothetical protein
VLEAAALQVVCELALHNEDRNALNDKGTRYLNSKGQRMYLEDGLEDGDTVFSMVGIAGG